jgi:hypothetical protein
MNCPHCQTQLDITGLSGMFACPRCGQTIEISPTPPPLANVSVASPAAPVFEASSAEESILSKRPKSGGPLAFLDLKFEYYLTPTIIRFYWATAIIIAVLTFVFRLVTLLESKFKKAPSTQPHFEFRSPFSDTDVPGSDGWIPDFIYDGGFYLLMVIGMVAMLLFIRLVCEFVIVLFDISTTLKDIRDKEKGLK